MDVVASQKYITVAAAGFACGVAVNSVMNGGYALAGLFCVFASALWFVRQRGLLVVLCVLAALGAVRAQITLDTLALVNSSYEPGRPEKVLFHALSSSSRSGDYIRFMAEDASTTAHLFVDARSAEDVTKGDTLQVIGTIVPDYNRKGSGILNDLQVTKLQITERVAPTFLDTIRNSFLHALRTTISEPEATLVAGIVIGEQGDMPKEISQAFRTAGLSHIVVLSGYNITIIAAVIIAIIGAWSFTASIVVSAIAIILFVLMAGGGSSAIRAVVMAMMMLFGKWIGRPYSAGIALWTAAALMVVWNPLILVYDVGFQLSVLATAGMIYGVPVIEPRLHFVTERFGLREALAGTVSATLFVAPIIAYIFGTVSLVAIPANMVVLPFVPLVMAVGLATGVVGMAVPFFALVPAFLSQELAAVILSCTQFFANIPFASVAIPQPSVVVVMLLYFVLFYVFIYAEGW